MKNNEHQNRSYSADDLTSDEVASWIKDFFNPGADDNVMTIWIDVPESEAYDTGAWQGRRKFAWKWCEMISASESKFHVEVRSYAYANVRQPGEEPPKDMYRLTQLPPNLSVINLAALGRLENLRSESNRNT